MNFFEFFTRNKTLHYLETVIMPTIKDVKDAVTAGVQAVKDHIATESAQVQAKVKELQDKIDALTVGAITQEDIDGIKATLAELPGAVDAIMPDAEPNSGGGPGEEQPTP